MPRRRLELDRSQKTREILDAAIGRLRTDGYEGLSIAALARDLGVASNAIYWYFPSKDELVVAAVEEMLRDIIGRKPPASRGLEHQVLWFVDQLRELTDVRTALAQRARSSPVVATFVSDVNAQLRRMLAHALEPHVPAADLDDATDAFLATFHGTQVGSLSQQRRRRVLRYALQRLTDAR